MSVISENPKVSVLIPVYNYEKYVAKCIESVINQTYKNVEIIAVDDGSTDRSGIILDEYAQKDNRLHVIHKENGGIGSAIKTAIENANGEYIAFLDSDDYMDLDAYEKLVDVALKNDADIVMFGLRMVAMDGHLRSKTTTEPVLLETNDEVLDDYMHKNPITPLSRKFIRASLLTNLVMMNYSVGIDEIISIQVMAKCNKLVRVKEHYYNAVGEPAKDSVSRRAIDGKHIETIINMHRDIIEYISRSVSKYTNEYIMRYLCILIGQYVVVMQLQKDRDQLEYIYSEYRKLWQSIKTTKEYRAANIKTKIQLLFFASLPKQYALLRGLRFERR